MSATSAPPSTPPWERFVLELERLELLDRIAEPAARAVRAAVPVGPAKDALSGTWLGHAVHPMLTDIVIGSFVSATLLDLTAGKNARPASERLIALGVAAYAPTALTGAHDWADSAPADPRVRRAGLAHAAANAAALSLYSGSLAARRRDRHGVGVALGLAGATVLMVGGYLGAHLSLRRGVGPDQTAFDPGPEEWTRAVDSSAVDERDPVRVIVQDTPVVLWREGGELFALHDRCSHRGCSLSDGTLEDGAIVCGCHGSRFDRRDGSVLRGPATAPQPAFEVRVQDGAIEVRRRAE